MAITRKSIWKAVLLAAASTGLSGCVYDVGLGFASGGYYDAAYGCDPYAGYDAYYNCDYGQAFSNIGFAGGWYDSYYYPGYGIFLFDIVGRRYPMREQYRRYWGERRHKWYREHRGRDLDRNRYEGRGRGYEGNARSERSLSPDRQGVLILDRDHDRRDGRRGGSRNSNDQWRGGAGRGAGAVPLPNTGASQGRGRGQDYGNDYRHPVRLGSGAPDRNAAPASPRAVLSTRQNVTSAEQLPEARPQHQGPKTPRKRMSEGAEERPDQWAFFSIYDDK